MTAGRYSPRKSNLTDSTAFSFSPMIFALQPLAHQGKRTNRAPDPSADRYQHQDQGREPEYPYDHRTGVASGNFGAEQARQDDKPEYAQHRKRHVELKRWRFQGSFQPGKKAEQ